MLRDNQRLLFVAGLHRSGTTAVARLLAEHPDVSGLSRTGVKEDEGQHLQHVYPAAREYGGAGRFAFREAAHLTEASPLARPETADRLWEAWSPHWDVTCDVLVEKSPPNLVMTRFLQAVFPTARFLGVVRHPAVVALSTSRWRARMSLRRLLAHWIAAHRIFVKDSGVVRHLSVVQYERLMAAPGPTLAALQAFLALSTPLSSATLQGGRSDGYRQQWLAISQGSTRRRRAFDRLCEEFEPQVREFGYSLRDIDEVGEFPLLGAPPLS